jgi:DNA processing protein
MDETCTSGSLIDWLKLLRAPLLSPRLCKRLLDIYTLPGSVISLDDYQLRQAGVSMEAIKSFRHPDWKSIERDIAWIDRSGNHFISCKDNNFPELLKFIDDTPLGLFVSGNIDVLNRTQIAIVGTRKPTRGGRRIAYDLARALSHTGLAVTSGLATGIDTAAHKGALSLSNPTIAVLGCGADIFYPRSNRDLSAEITEQGAVVSEFPTMTPPRSLNFPRRNRIISGLSVGTVVVEAALKSGSLITARLAMEQGREVFAVPGSIQNPAVLGCHALIKQGAKLTTGIEDILEEIGSLCAVTDPLIRVPSTSKQFTERLDEKSKVLLDNIGYGAVTVDELVEETGVGVKEICVLLLDLELKDLVDSLPGGRFTRK